MKYPPIAGKFRNVAKKCCLWCALILGVVCTCLICFLEMHTRRRCSYYETQYRFGDDLQREYIVGEFSQDRWRELIAFRLRCRTGRRARVAEALFAQELLQKGCYEEGLWACLELLESQDISAELRSELQNDAKMIRLKLQWDSMPQLFESSAPDRSECMSLSFSPDEDMILKHGEFVLHGSSDIREFILETNTERARAIVLDGRIRGDLSSFIETVQFLQAHATHLYLPGLDDRLVRITTSCFYETVLFHPPRLKFSGIDLVRTSLALEDATAFGSDAVITLDDDPGVLLNDVRTDWILLSKIFASRSWQEDQRIFVIAADAGTCIQAFGYLLERCVQAGAIRIILATAPKGESRGV